MSAQVIIWRGVTKHNLPTDRVLEQAMWAGLDGAVVIGWDPDGELYFASTYANGGDVLWLMEHAKAALIKATV